MALIVQKFGGTSVGSVERIEQVADKVKKFRDAGDDLVVVLSAMSGETNRLIELAKQISGDQAPLARELDVIVSTGEQVTIALLALVDQLKNKLGRAVILLGSVHEEKVVLVAGVTKDLTGQLKAGDLMKQAAAAVGGKGGGRPDMAQGGGVDAGALDAALALTVPFVEAGI